MEPCSTYMMSVRMLLPACLVFLLPPLTLAKPSPTYIDTYGHLPLQSSLHSISMSKREDPNMSNEIRDHEHQAWAALCQSGTALLALLSPRCTMLFPGGMMLHDESEPTLRSILTGDDSFTPWKKYILTDDRVVFLDEKASAAQIFYRVAAERETADGVLVFNALCSSTWARRDGGGWEMVAHQQTLI